MNSQSGQINQQTVADSTQVDSSDDALLILAAQNDSASFALLYRRHVTSVYRFLCARLGNVEDAQDVTSQTFVTALEKLATYRGEGSVRSWLLGIAKNKALHHQRQNRPNSSLRLLENGSVDELSVIDLGIDKVANQLDSKQLLSQLRILSADRLEAISLRFFSELSMAEIAQIMGKSEAAVKMLVHRGLKDLQHRLSESNAQQPVPEEQYS